MGVGGSFPGEGGNEGVCTGEWITVVKFYFTNSETTRKTSFLLEG